MHLSSASPRGRLRRFAAAALERFATVEHPQVPSIAPELRGVLAELAQLHRLSSGSKAPTSDAWSAIRKRAVSLTDSLDEALPAIHIARFAESIAWPASEAADEVAAKTRGRRERLLEIHARTDGEAAERGEVVRIASTAAVPPVLPEGWDPTAATL